MLAKSKEVKREGITTFEQSFVFSGLMRVVRAGGIIIQDLNETALYFKT